MRAEGWGGEAVDDVLFLFFDSLRSVVSDWVDA